MEILSERLAYWFLRLNGFITTANFIVHREEGMGQHTDVDVLAIRFPNRRENQIRPMQGDRRLVDATRIQLVLAEAKLAECGFNLSWLQPDRGNMRRTLAAVGAFDDDRLEQVCEGMYRDGEWTDGTYWVRLVAFGVHRNRTMAHGAVGQVPQFRWREDVLPFIHERFWSYRNENWYHGQWDDDAKKLFRAMVRHGDDMAGFVGENRVVERR